MTQKIIAKAHFWKAHADVTLNERQRHILNRLLDQFEGKLTSSKWAKIAKCSQDTALRDIDALLEHNILIKEEAGGRSTSYRLHWPLHEAAIK
jgi:Fic family protein